MMTMAIDRYRAWLWALTVLWVLTAMAVIALFRAETLGASDLKAAKFVLGGCDACNCGSNSTAQR